MQSYALQLQKGKASFATTIGNMNVISELTLKKD
jgi:hypothetical protein